MFIFFLRIEHTTIEKREKEIEEGLISGARATNQRRSGGMIYGLRETHF
jgi:hypothetical protein